MSFIQSRYVLLISFPFDLICISLLSLLWLALFLYFVISLYVEALILYYFTFFILLLFYLTLFYFIFFVIHLSSYLIQQDLGIISIWGYQVYVLILGGYSIAVICASIYSGYLSKSLFDLSYLIRSAINLVLQFPVVTFDKPSKYCARFLWFR